MYCPNCRNHVDNNVDFCPSCGTNIKELRQMIEHPPSVVQPTEEVVEPLPDNKINNSIQTTNNNVKKK